MIDAKGYMDWLTTAKKLSATWLHSMRMRGARLEQEEIEAFLIDLWIERNGNDDIFLEAHRGRLYNYCYLHLAHRHDALSKALGIDDLRMKEDGDESPEDHLELLSVVDDDPQSMLEQRELSESIEVYLEQIRSIRSSGLSGALASLFGLSDRSGRICAATIRRTKIAGIIKKAAKDNGVSPAELKRMAAEVILEWRGDPNDLADFAAIFGLDSPAASTSEGKSQMTPRTCEDEQMALF